MDYSPPATSALALPTIYDQLDGRPNADFTDCDGCESGIVERVVDDYDGDTGRIGYEYLNGSGSVATQYQGCPSVYCAACMARPEVAA